MFNIKYLWVEYKGQKFKLDGIDFDQYNLLNLIIMIKYVVNEDGFQF